MLPHRTSRRSLARAGGILGSLAIATALLTGCAADATTTEGGSEPTAVSFQTSWIPMVQFGGSYIAQDAGYYEDEGLDVTILPGGPEVDGTALVAAGTVDIGVSNADNVARANEAGADLVIIGAGFQKNPLALLSLASDPIDNPEAMYGKKIGIPAGDSATHDALVEFNDLDASQIEQVPAGFDVAPLLSGEVDGLYVFYTEQPIALEEAGEEGTTFLLADYGMDVFAQVYFVTRDTFENKKDLITAFMTAEIKGWQDFVADPSPAVDLAVNEYGKDSGLTESQQTKQSERQIELLMTPDTEANGLLTMSEEKIQANLDTLEKLGIPATEDLFDTSILDAIYDGKPSL